MEDEHTWTEQIEIAGSELVDRTKELIEEGNVRRLIIRTPEDEKLLEVPLTAGVVVGGALTVLAPILAALGAMAALLARVKVEIVRTEHKAEEPPNPPTPSSDDVRLKTLILNSGAALWARLIEGLS